MTAIPASMIASSHWPQSVLNHTGKGIRTITVCSCGWKPVGASERVTTCDNAHMAHRRLLGLPRADYSATVFGEGPWTGWTWNDWYAEYGSKHVHVDPYTGNERRW